MEQHGDQLREAMKQFVLVAFCPKSEVADFPPPQCTEPHPIGASSSQQTGAIGAGTMTNAQIGPVPQMHIL